MLYSPTCQHALRALAYLATRAGEGPILVRDIAEAESIPKPYLSKILHGLQTRGLLNSRKGPRGGYELARKPELLLVSEIVEAIDGPMDLEVKCILGLDLCHDDQKCALHDIWKESREKFVNVMRDLTLADMASTIEKKRRGENRQRGRKS